METRFLSKLVFVVFNKGKNVKDHISIYLVLAGANTSQIHWGVHAVFRLFLLDQNTGNYLVFQGTISFISGFIYQQGYKNTIWFLLSDGHVHCLEEKERHFHAMKLDWGFDQFLSIKAFTEASNGFLVDDTCVLGAEVFVSKERSMGKGECLSMVKDAVAYKHVWKIDSFSKIITDCHESKIFSSGDQNWKIQLYPKGKGSGMGSHLSLALALADPTSLPPGTKIYTKFTLCIIDQKHEEHKAGKDFYRIPASFWFSASNSERVLPEFIPRSSFSHTGWGFLLKDSCTVEAEVTVHGMSTAL